MVGATYTLGHVQILTSFGVLDDQLVSVVDGKIEQIGQHPAGLVADLDGRGHLCLPGIVDLHSDALSREYRPRPGARLPIDLALQAAEGNLLAAGVTTAFHAVSFQAKTPVGIPIGSPNAPEVHEEIRSYQDPRMDHHVLHRLDVRCPVGVQMLKSVLDREHVPLISYEDHTPGQGQYRDRTVMERWLQEAQHMGAQQSVEHVDSLISDRDQQLAFREQTLQWLSELAASQRIRLMGHDPVTSAEIDQLVQRHATIAEFPTTLEAARHARLHGIDTVAGAPNVLLGKSHSGNVAAIDLARAGVLSILASDYLPSSMLVAAFELADVGLLSLYEAVRLISENPAKAAGLLDRGVVSEGYRADLVLCRVVNGRPRVERALVARG